MTLSLWSTFALATFLICASPGPNMLLMMKSGIEHGLKRTFFTAAGCFLGVVLLIGASVAGVGALLQLFPELFTVLRYAGAFYLIYLGVQAWRAPVVVETDGMATAHTPAKLFRMGFLVAMSNPKALIFAAAFFPQFIAPESPQLPQMLILLATFAVLEISWFTIYATGGQRLASVMRNPLARRRLQRATGSLFALFGILLLVKSP